MVATPMPKSEGARERVSGFRPENPIEIGGLFVWPPKPLAIARFLFGFPGFLWPWEILFFGIAFVAWIIFFPDQISAKHISWHSALGLFAFNCSVQVAFVSVWHVRLYVQQIQGMEYKYNPRWLSVGNKTFLFKNQLWDNIFWTFASAVPIVTGYEILTVWLHANGFVRTVSWQSAPIYCSALLLLTPFWLSIHFYATHRLIHLEPLYRYVHYIHHKNINIGPWSGVAMHPIEHLIYFSGAALFWIVPSHPVHSFLTLVHLVLGSTLGHHGFDRVRVSKRSYAGTGHYWHYLHHKLFKVNYGDPLVPLDRWLGTFHDGTDQAQEKLRKRITSLR